MAETLGGITSAIARLALDAAAQRLEVTAHNVANAGTPGFVPKRVEFAAQLRELVNEVAAGAGSARLDARVAELGERLRGGEALMRHPEQTVEVDVEMTGVAETVLQYRALLESLSKRGDVLRLAIRERGL
jgi:flagellar basal-body rod protein FlgB